jgi:hypothetical protein
MSIIRTIASLPEDLHTLCISDLGYASEVHDENDDIRAQLQAAFDAGEISGLGADDLDKLTIKDATLLVYATGHQADTNLHKVRSTAATKLGLQDYKSAVMEMRVVRDRLSKKGTGWTERTSPVSAKDRLDESGFQDHLQAIVTHFTEVPKFETLEETNRAQVGHRKVIQRMYSEALLHSALRSSLPSLIEGIRSQVTSTYKVKKGFGKSANQELHAISRIIDEIKSQPFVPSIEMAESCKSALTHLPLEADGDDLFYKLISKDGKRQSEAASECTLSDAKVYVDALRRYAQERHDKVVEEQGEPKKRSAFAKSTMPIADIS